MAYRHREGGAALRGVGLCMLAGSVLAACATTEDFQPQVATAPAPDVARPESVSVFGIFRNGRMSAEAWDDFGKALSTPLSEGICKAAYDVAFADANPELAAQIGDYTKDYGVSDELLAKFAPLAKGDTILLIAIDGQLPKPAAARVETPSKPAPQGASGQGNNGGSGAGQGGGPGGGRGMGRGGGGMGRGGMGGRRAQAAPAPQAKPDKGFWELTAYFYSVRLRQSTRQVELKQQGQDIDNALKLFAAKLGTEIPGVPCRDWDSIAKVDRDSIRKLAEQ